MVKHKPCDECFDIGTVFVYFVNHKDRTVIEEWEFCKKCYPNSLAYYDHLPANAELISKEEADRFINEEGYTKYVP